MDSLDGYISRLPQGRRRSTSPSFPTTQSTASCTVNMGKATKALKEFIASIPESKLTGFPTRSGEIWSTTEFRLDMQGMTSNREFNLQIQANRQAKITSVRGLAPQTVAGPVLVGEHEAVTAEQVRQRLSNSMLI
ncbi:hypothetical protein BDM02DRAFT_444822 [Thelephora ganbajun]|uniref:Uncharacterized protein n=1 Tax=Thelephora ganbajun TaxID=370292 RepID=A0ACB6ZR62_THEGA|nr:hypothetical protein BDM02DRAFT_444822 [Thelephora ganbajun]